ncbi:MAG TPA: tRNA-dihydrouridine synthase, partial [Rhabdochlamydiaceae bacterium]|nr:tRNA-dihydrouridine synthase [Rhabdochlamydiaceae bacterium]
WDLIAEAKSLLKSPVVGNGDILTVDDALKMLKTTGCDALMIGRGSIINPFIFHQIKAHFAGKPYIPQWQDLLRYFHVYRTEVPAEIPDKTRVNKLKQLMGFFFKGSAQLLEMRQTILTSQYSDPDSFMQFALPMLELHFKSF